jgi:hypothetical protein
MKKYSIFVCLVIAFVILTGCSNTGDKNETNFIATVLENDQSSLLVQPEEGSSELRSADKITVYVKDVTLLDSEGKEITIDDIAKGDKVQIFYNGGIAESYPAQIHKCPKIRILD